MPRLRDAVEEPIQVFVSSNQDEFDRLRKSLRSRIELQSQGHKWLFDVKLPEHSHSAHVKREIDRLLAISSIFVVLIGRKKSKWVNYEVDYALSNELPILAYEYYSRVRRRTGRPASASETRNLLLKLRKADVRLRGHKGEFQEAEEVVTAVLDDLPELISRIVNHYAGISREISKRV